MSLTGKITLAVTCVLLMCGALILRPLHRKLAAKQKLAQEADHYRARAVQGDAESQSKLGSFYFYGKGVEQNYSEALRWHQKAADQGYAPAEYSLGYVYSQGKGVPQSYPDAVRWVQKAADQGDTKAECALAQSYFYGQGVPQNYSEAVRWYQKAADQGYARAQYYLGYMYYEGKGVPQSYSESVHWFQKAADSGDAEAQDALGIAYASGRGLPQDDSQAVWWYKKAADQGFARAEYDIGYMYHEGRGVPEDLALAARYVLKAARQGEPRALSVVKKPLGLGTIIFGSICFLGGMALLIGAYRDDGIFSPRYRIPVVGGVLALLYGVLDLYGLTHILLLQAFSALNFFYVSQNLVGGADVAILALVVLPRSYSVSLKLSGLLLIAFDVYAIRHPLWRFSWSGRTFYSTNGFLLGILAASAAILWMSGRKSSRQTQTQ
jgi:TPR repeat protein